MRARLPQSPAAWPGAGARRGAPSPLPSLLPLTLAGARGALHTPRRAQIARVRPTTAAPRLGSVGVCHLAPSHSQPGPATPLATPLPQNELEDLYEIDHHEIDHHEIDGQHLTLSMCPPDRGEEERGPVRTARCTMKTRQAGGAAGRPEKRAHSCECRLFTEALQKHRSGAVQQKHATLPCYLPFAPKP